MPFSSFQGIFEPDHLRLLSRVLDRICLSIDPAPGEQDRHYIAFRLVSLFKTGTTDEEALFTLCTGDEAA